MAKPAKLPTFDHAKDGNPFEWIVRQMPGLHDKQARERQCRPRYDPLTGRPIVRSTPERV